MIVYLLDIYCRRITDIVYDIYFLKANMFRHFYAQANIYHKTFTYISSYAIEAKVYL